LCPAYGRGCFGCFGATRQARAGAMAGLLRATAGNSPAARKAVRLTLSSVNPADPVFQAVGAEIAGDAHDEAEA
jgi:hypothetical protein